MNSNQAQKTESPAYRLLLPMPAMLKLLADGSAGAVSNEVRRVLTELEKAIGPVPLEQVAIICDRVITEFAVTDAVADAIAPAPPEGHGPIYDFYFAVERLPASAAKDTIVKALVVAVAVVMKNTAALETRTSGVSPVEFGLLQHAFSVIIEALQELSAES
jgi:hypothetical protein